jgi:signal transduction histidine kinase
MKDQAGQNGFPLPAMRLTTVVPVVLSAAVFVFTLGVAWVAADMANLRNQELLGEKAQVFLDATAGHIGQGAPVTATAMTDALSSALTYKSVLGEEAVAVGRLIGPEFVVVGMPVEADQAMRNRLYEAWESGAPGRFSIGPDGKGSLTGLYGQDNDLFAVAGVFDTSELFAANQATHRAALGLSLLVAFATAIASYGVARMAISPVVALAARLAEGDTGSAKVRRGQYLSSEILEIESILSTRRKDDRSRADMAQRLAQIERDQVLARLAATLAHEVRNPLAGIRNAFSTLRRYGDEKAVREETLDIIEGGLDSLQRLTDVTLSTYRRRSGDGVINASDIRDLALIVSPQVKEKRLTISWAIPEATHIVGDVDAIRQMLVNLLLNACKASPASETVWVAAATERAGVRISISDSGEGMPEGVLLHLREGQTATVSESRDLGLWIVHSLADELNASVSIESKADQGTTVFVLFPHASAETSGA